MAVERIHALTSLVPGPQAVATQREAIQSWRDAGLEVVSFNDPSEVAAVAAAHEVRVVPVARTSASVFGRPYVPIGAMLDWAEAAGTAALVVNADIVLRLAAWELKRLRWLADGGLCWLVRHNHDGDPSRARREPSGIDAFLLHGRDRKVLGESFLSMGQPFWDWWLPLAFAAAGRPLHAVEFPAAFHRSHPQRWSWDGWVRCALEFDRLTGALGARGSPERCFANAGQVRRAIDARRKLVPPRPPPIRGLVERTFGSRASRTFLELGAHDGSDTAWLAAVPGATVHAFEPDPRNHPPPRPNVVLNRAAVWDRDGRAPLVLSKEGWGVEWTHSSSLRRPKEHLRRYPVTFGESVEVETVALDTYRARAGLDVVDLVWASLQGAEADMIRGGRATLARTRYLYTEWADEEMYEGQATLAEILALLPGFRVVEMWDADVLLENRALRSWRSGEEGAGAVSSRDPLADARPA